MTMRERITGNGGFVKGGDWFAPPPPGTPAPSAPKALCGPPDVREGQTMNAADFAKFRKDERENMLAHTIADSWAEHVPLSVRYRAAVVADSIVAEWFDRERSVSLPEPPEGRNK